MGAQFTRADRLQRSRQVCERFRARGAGGFQQRGICTAHDFRSRIQRTQQSVRTGGQIEVMVLGMLAARVEPLWRLPQAEGLTLVGGEKIMADHYRVGGRKAAFGYRMRVAHRAEGAGDCGDRHRVGMG